MENDSECPICNQENQKILQKLNNKRTLVSDEGFKSQIEKTTDGFGTIIDMLSRGEITVQKEKVRQKSGDGEDPFGIPGSILEFKTLSSRNYDS